MALKVASLATGMGEKAVSLFYEKRLHKEVSEVWVKRCRSQIAATLAALEKDRAGRRSDNWFGGPIGHADIVVATVLRFTAEAHPGLIEMAIYPALKAHAERLEALPVFKEIMQPFNAPA